MTKPFTGGAEVKVSEFSVQTQLHLERFVDYWLHRRIDEPKNFPLELPEADWREQFEAFVFLEDG